MSWFTHPHKDAQAELDQVIGWQSKVLAWATGSEILLAGTKDFFAYRTGKQWCYWPWEKVGGGAWSADDDTFSWRILEGDNYQVQLSEPGRLIEFFKERVQASTLVTTVVEVSGGAVQIIGRRRPDRSDAITWYAVPSGTADLADPRTKAAVVAETDRLKAELAD